MPVRREAVRISATPKKREQIWQKAALTPSAGTIRGGNGTWRSLTERDLL